MTLAQSRIPLAASAPLLLVLAGCGGNRAGSWDMGVAVDAAPPDLAPADAGDLGVPVDAGPPDLAIREGPQGIHLGTRVADGDFLGLTADDFIVYYRHNASLEVVRPDGSGHQVLTVAPGSTTNVTIESTAVLYTTDTRYANGYLTGALFAWTAAYGVVPLSTQSWLLHASSDGTHVAFPDGNGQLALFDLSTGQRIDVRSKVFTNPYCGGKPIFSANRFATTWCPDPPPSDTGPASLSVFELSTGAETVVFDGNVSNRHFFLSADGSRVAASFENWNGVRTAAVDAPGSAVDLPGLFPVWVAKDGSSLLYLGAGGDYYLSSPLTRWTASTGSIVSGAQVFRSVQVSPDDKWVLVPASGYPISSGDQFFSALLVSVADPTEVRTLVAPPTKGGTLLPFGFTRDSTQALIVDQRPTTCIIPDPRFPYDKSCTFGGGTLQAFRVDGSGSTTTLAGDASSARAGAGARVAWQTTTELHVGNGTLSALVGTYTVDDAYTFTNAGDQLVYFYNSTSADSGIYVFDVP